MGSLATQGDVIERVPTEHRGIFYAMAHLTLRNGEARALRSGDTDFRRSEGRDNADAETVSDERENRRQMVALEDLLKLNLRAAANS